MAQLVAHLVRDQEVARSSRVTQTAKAAGMHPAAFFTVRVTPLRFMDEGVFPLVLPCVGLRPPIITPHKDAVYLFRLYIYSLTGRMVYPKQRLVSPMPSVFFFGLTVSIQANGATS